ncbi:MAG: glycerol-3-phosphate dehydrogenase/oxidase [Chloroflexota bacterium]|nr:glycerol-3-phosphate dehydrogenase/oxidase [Chloroflexota bacterium]
MLREFSPRTRTESLAAIDKNEPFDILIIGGGITGAGAARDAALRGYNVALVEKRDFASGASSKSTKLVHGGLRYLENYEFALVFEALQERRVLLEQASHCVRPQPLVFPVYKGGKYGFPKMMAGMWAYDVLSLFRNIARHRMIRGADKVEQQFPGIRDSQLVGAARYYDANTHDARLTLANAQQAHDAGAELFTYMTVLDFLRDGQGRLVGVRVRDELSGEEHDIHARVVVNCTGPWTDQVIQMADPSQPPRMVPSKGVHLVFAKERLPMNGEAALYVEAPQDNRPVFIIPWENVTIIGTTDTFYDGSLDDIPVTEEDVEYLLEVANHAFPDAQLTKDDVQSSWAGLRPLVKDPSAKDEGSTSREHEIWEAPEGLVNIAGGKLTTYRVMAKEVIDQAAEKLQQRYGIAKKEAAETEDIPLPGAEYPLPEENRSTLPDDVWEHLVKYYGIYAQDVAGRAQEDPALAERIVEGLPYIWAELPHAIEYEMCLTADDFLARRTWLIYEAPKRGAEVLDEVISRMGDMLDWDDERREAERQRYQHELDLVVGS